MLSSCPLPVVFVPWSRLRKFEKVSLFRRLRMAARWLSSTSLRYRPLDMNGYGNSNGASTSAQAAAAAAAAGDSGVQVPIGPTNQPRILVRNLTDTETTFHLSGVELGYANSVRRVMMADVPTIGQYHCPMTVRILGEWRLTR